jgi:hypothetical protein
VALIAFVVILVYHLGSQMLGLIQMFGLSENQYQFQQGKIPNYYDALREQDLEELVEEE